MEAVREGDVLILNACFFACFSVEITVLNGHEIVLFGLPDEAGRIGGFYVLLERVFIEQSLCFFVVSVVDIDSDSAAQIQTDLDMYFSFDEIVAVYG